MIKRWQFWAVPCVALAVIAEAINILAPETLFIQWALFVLSVVFFIIAITLWDRQSPRRKRQRQSAIVSNSHNLKRESPSQSFA